MATAKTTLKKWFSNFMKPTQWQFWSWLDSYWHKDEQISITSIEGLQELLEDVASAEQLRNHAEDTEAHKTLIDGLKERLNTLETAQTDPAALSELTERIGALEKTLAVDDADLDTLQEIVTKLKANPDVSALLADKQDKIAGKSLSTNDFTNELKTKLESLDASCCETLKQELAALRKELQDNGALPKPLPEGQQSEMAEYLDKNDYIGWHREVVGGGAGVTNITYFHLENINASAPRGIVKLSAASKVEAYIKTTPPLGSVYEVEYNKCIIAFKDGSLLKYTLRNNLSYREISDWSTADKEYMIELDFSLPYYLQVPKDKEITDIILCFREFNSQEAMGLAVPLAIATTSKEKQTELGIVVELNPKE